MKYSIEELTESLTGFEEIAIEKNFGGDIGDLAENKPLSFSRALAFILEKRGGKTDKDARQAVMEMSRKAVNDLFDLDDEEDEESGKGVNAPETTPSASPPSV